MADIISPALAIGSATVYGAADFIGGLATRRATALAVAATSQLAGFVLLVGAMLVLPAAPVTARDLVWGGVSGVSGAVGLTLLYRAFALGRMSVVAPVTAVCGIAIPVLLGLVLGERPGTAALAGVALAVLAVVLVSQEGEASAAGEKRAVLAHPVVIALASGVAVGIFYIGFARASHAAGLWPVLAARVCSLSTMGIIALARRAPLRIPRALLPIVCFAGALDVAGNVAYLFALHGGLLSVVATLVSLYPASTVLLARVVLHERLRPIQLGGLALAAGAVLLIA